MGKGQRPVTECCAKISRRRNVGLMAQYTWGLKEQHIWVVEKICTRVSWTPDNRLRVVAKTVLKESIETDLGSVLVCVQHV